jgi:sigma-E factor negative regulatory protein RseB
VRRLAAAVAGVGLLVPTAPVLASGPDEAAAERQALDLLERAADASHTVTYTGTQFVASWRSSSATSALVDIWHEPGRGAVVSVPPTATRAGVDTSVSLGGANVDDDLLDVLGERYTLRIGDDGRCAGRDADVVEARRPDRSGAGSVAGRFWLDRRTGLLLRREVFDADGRRVRSTAFVDVSVGEPDALATQPEMTTQVRPAQRGRPVSTAQLNRMRDDGWHVAARLPAGFRLFDVRRSAHGDAEVLHLAYSDGLSTTSLFSQPGELGTSAPDGFAPHTADGRPVWTASDGVVRRMVWAGGGRVWTLVSDAPDDVVTRQVAVLPHDAIPDDGPGARLVRGLSRLGAMLNPFS